MDVSSRPASEQDIPRLVTLYRELEHEMVDLKPVWRVTDGLAEPVETTIAALLEDPSRHLIVGQIEEVTFGFLHGGIGDLLPQAGDAKLGTVHHIFVSSPARGVGVGETMIDRFLSVLDAEGITLVDAVAPPGHRHAKNFFEANGFSARRIVMHRSNEEGK